MEVEAASMNALEARFHANGWRLSLQALTRPRLSA
jgi:hypothetical protein